jgi:hypothetical protein
MVRSSPPEFSWLVTMLGGFKQILCQITSRGQNLAVTTVTLRVAIAVTIAP